MKTKFSIYFILCFVLLTNLSTAQTKFETALGDSLADYCFSVKQTTDKGFILSGYTNSFSLNADNDFYLIKTDSLSNIVWAKSYGGVKDDEGYSILQTTDGGYLMTGYTRSFGTQYYDACLLKTDANGNVDWLKAYGGLGLDFGNTVTQTNDGGYIMAGYTTKSKIVGDTASMYIVKTDAQGNLLWQKLLGAGNEVTDAYNIKQTADKGYIITGYTNGFGEINGDAFFIKTDSLANPIFAKTFGYKGIDWGDVICATSDGGYIIGGSYSTDSTSTDIDVYIIKTNADGDTLWTRTYGGPEGDYGQCILQTNDGGYVLGGYTNSFGAGSYDAFLLKLDANGDTLFAKTFGGTGDDEANTIIQTSDGGYALTGQSNSFGNGDYDFYFIKTDANGNSSCKQTDVHPTKKTPKAIIAGVPILQNTPDAYQVNATVFPHNSALAVDVCNSLEIKDWKVKQAEVRVYPNPTSGIFTISFTNEEKGTISIQNILGETVYAGDINTDKQINLQHLANGTYFAYIQTTGKNYNQKVVIAK